MTPEEVFNLLMNELDYVIEVLQKRIGAIEDRLDESEDDDLRWPSVERK